MRKPAIISVKTGLCVAAALLLCAPAAFAEPIGVYYNSLSPAAGAPQAQAAPAPAAEAISANPPEPKIELPQTQPAAPAEKPAESVSTTAPASAAASPKAPQAKPQDDSMVLPPDEMPVKPLVNASGETIVSVSASSDSVILRFPFTTRVATAVFIRSRYLWVVISGAHPVDISEFNDMSQTVIGKPELKMTPKFTVLRLPVDDNVYPYVLREDNSSGWTIEIQPKKRPLSQSLKAEINTDPPAPAHVFIAAEEIADPISMRDPRIGDDLVITPIYVPGQGVPLKREFVDFTLLQTAQGVAVAKKDDQVEVTPMRNGLRVALPQGATLTQGLPEVQAEKAAGALLDNSTFFPYELWKPEKPENPRKQIVKLFHQIVESKTPQEGNEARLRLAQIYLSMGMAAEAIAMLDGIERVNPAFYHSAKLAALHGAANVLMYRFQEAAQDFSVAELNNSKEAEYWRSMLADLLGGNGQGYDYMSLNRDYISKYPPLFRQRLAIFAADRSIGAKEYNTALKIFDALQKDELIEPIKPYVSFLLAKISADNGQQKEATEIWDKLAVDYAHPFVQARAEFSRIAYGMEKGSIDKDQAIDRLERLRLGWHGDTLELNVLVILGDLYAEKQDYVNAMRIWHGGIQTFPNTAESVNMRQKMQNAFITMFNEGAADSLPALDSLALYYEYRKYTPPGIAGGEMVERLADRLTSVDLLDQASFVLDQQMRTQTEKDNRSRIGAKLATLALLNRQPKKAIIALEDSVYGENEPIMRQLRNRLAAQAMADLGLSDKSLQTLGQDLTEDAHRIRLGVYWKHKDWPKVIQSAEAILKERQPITALLKPEETEVVLKLALAYAFENDSVQLTYLRDYFTPLLEGNPQKPIFDFITNPGVMPTPTNFDDVLKDLASTRSFLDGYRARIKEEGLDAIQQPVAEEKAGAVKPEPKAEEKTEAAKEVEPKAEEAK